MTKVSTITPCYNMSKYMKGFLDNLSTQTHKDLEIVLDHNDPSDEEVKLVEEYNEQYDNILHIKVEGVDPIGTSMNRCIEYATGDYLCIWNVDDLRTPDSIEVMAKALDENPDVDFVYGNYIIVPKFGSTEGQYVDETGEKMNYNRYDLGPYFMFRKSLLEKSGVFDEQLVQGADYDLALRLAFNAKGLHLPINLGYYLNEGLGQSTKPDSKQPIERTVIELRYNIRVLEPHLVPYTRTYDVGNIIVDEEKFQFLILDESHNTEKIISDTQSSPYIKWNDESLADLIRNDNVYNVFIFNKDGNHGYFSLLHNLTSNIEGTIVELGNREGLGILSIYDALSEKVNYIHLIL